MKKFSKEFFQRQGSIGGRRAKHVLTSAQARKMVKAREAKRKTNAK